MRRLFRRGDDILWAALALLVMLVVMSTLLRMTARYAPSPISDFARTAGRAADPGNV